jgi:DNA-binding protein H-NS
VTYEKLLCNDPVSTGIKCGNFGHPELPAQSELNSRQRKLQGEDMKFGKFNLSTLSIDELWALHEEVGNILSEKLKSEKIELEQRLAKLNGGMMARTNRPDVAVGERRPTRRKYPPVHPKFQNPSDPSETWAGRGKQPRWMVLQLKAGRKMDDFLIDRGKRKRVTNR